MNLTDGDLVNDYGGRSVPETLTLGIQLDIDSLRPLAIWADDRIDRGGRCPIATSRSWRERGVDELLGH